MAIDLIQRRGRIKSDLGISDLSELDGVTPQTGDVLQFGSAGWGSSPVAAPTTALEPLGTIKTSGDVYDAFTDFPQGEHDSFLVQWSNLVPTASTRPSLIAQIQYYDTNGAKSTRTSSYYTIKTYSNASEVTDASYAGNTAGFELSGGETTSDYTATGAGQGCSGYFYLQTRIGAHPRIMGQSFSRLGTGTFQQMSFCGCNFSTLGGGQIAGIRFTWRGNFASQTDGEISVHGLRKQS